MLLKEAIDDCITAIRLDPNVAPAFANLGCAYAALGENEKAIKTFDRAIAIDDKCLPAYSGRCKAHKAIGMNKLAQQDSDIALKLGFWPESKVFLADED